MHTSHCSVDMKLHKLYFPHKALLIGFTWLKLMNCCFFKNYSFIYLAAPGPSSNPLQYSCLENPMDRGAWWTAVHGVAKSWTWLSDFTFTFHFQALEKEMATHSSTLAWKIPWTEKPGRLQSMGSQRVGHDWVTSLSFTFHGPNIPGSDAILFFTALDFTSITSHILTWVLFSLWFSLFILELFLHSSPVVYWGPTYLVSSSFCANRTVLV